MLFNFNLAADVPGWANPTLSVDEIALDMTASYLSDALGELLQALMPLANGSATASCQWTQEPAAGGGTSHDLTLSASMS